MSVVGTLRALQPRKLYLVVNHQLPFQARDNVFIEPTASPFYEAHFVPVPADQAKQKWMELSILKIQVMESFKQTCAREVRKRKRKGKEDNHRTKSLERHARWIVPSVHHVDSQSVSLQRDWRNAGF